MEQGLNVGGVDVVFGDEGGAGVYALQFHGAAPADPLPRLVDAVVAHAEGVLGDEELHAMAWGEMFADADTPAPNLDDEAGRWALSLLKDLRERAAPEETPDWHYDEVAACFRRGKAAMSTDWPGSFYTYEDPEQSAVVGSYDVALYPQGPAGRFVYSSSHTFAIPSTVRDRPAAIGLLRFLTSRRSQVLEAKLGTLPARADSLVDARAEVEADSLAERRWELLAETEEAALVPPKHPNYPAVEDAIWEGIREALLGTKSVEQALADTEAAARHAATIRR
jgi:multiple sugar transport system substrate-binding protein